METLSRMIAWANYLLAWAWLIWFVVGIVVGGIMIALDERRLHRTRPKAGEVRAYADELVAQHGREAFRVNGGAMYEARVAKQFARYRFLKDVSGELVNRFFREPVFDSSTGTKPAMATHVLPRCFPEPIKRREPPTGDQLTF